MKIKFVAILILVIHVINPFSLHVCSCTVHNLLYKIMMSKNVLLISGCFCYCYFNNFKNKKSQLFNQFMKKKQVCSYDDL
jgi:hypothetical protein